MIGQNFWLKLGPDATLDKFSTEAVGGPTHFLTRDSNPDQCDQLANERKQNQCDQMLQ